MKHNATKTNPKTVSKENNVEEEVLFTSLRAKAWDEFHGQKQIKAALVKLQNTLDGFVGTVDELRTENVVGTHQIRELEVRVDKLESTQRTA